MELAAALVATVHEGDDGSPFSSSSSLSLSLSSFVGTPTPSSLRFFRGDGIVSRFCDLFGLWEGDYFVSLSCVNDEIKLHLRRALVAMCFFSVFSYRSIVGIFSGRAHYYLIAVALK